MQVKRSATPASNSPQTRRKVMILRLPEFGQLKSTSDKRQQVWLAKLKPILENNLIYHAAVSERLQQKKDDVWSTMLSYKANGLTWSKQLNMSGLANVWTLTM